MAETDQPTVADDGGRFATYDETLGRYVGPVGAKSDVDKFRRGYKPKTGGGETHATRVDRVGD
jgi:hypothetical protein